MSDEYQRVAVWVGYFPAEDRLARYLEEQYGDDDKPISEFAADQNQLFYDHDFVESGFRVTNSPRELLRGHSFSQSYLLPVEMALRGHSTDDINTVLLVWGGEIAKPQSVAGSGYRLMFLGTFPCDPDAGQIGE